MMTNASGMKSPWARIHTLHDLKNIDFFLSSFEHLRKISVARTGMPLRYDKERLIYIYSRYVRSSAATWEAFGKNADLIDTNYTVTKILAANLLEAFHNGTYGWIITDPATSPAETPSVPAGEELVSPNRFFACAYIYEYFLFLLYKNAGKDYEPELTRHDMAVVEHMIAYCSQKGFSPATFRSVFDDLMKHLSPYD